MDMRKDTLQNTFTTYTFLSLYHKQCMWSTNCISKRKLKALESCDVRRCSVCLEEVCWKIGPFSRAYPMRRLLVAPCNKFEGFSVVKAICSQRELAYFFFIGKHRNK